MKTFCYQTKNCCLPSARARLQVLGLYGVQRRVFILPSEGSDILSIIDGSRERCKAIIPRWSFSYSICIVAGRLSRSYSRLCRSDICVGPAGLCVLLCDAQKARLSRLQQSKLAARRAIAEGTRRFDEWQRRCRQHAADTTTLSLSDRRDAAITRFSADGSVKKDLFQLQHFHLLKCLEHTTVICRRRHSFLLLFPKLRQAYGRAFYNSFLSASGITFKNYRAATSTRVLDSKNYLSIFLLLEYSLNSTSRLQISTSGLNFCKLNY